MVGVLGFCGLVLKEEKMTKLRRLINEAKKSCEFRGHIMKRFTHSVPYNGIIWGHAYSECEACKKSVMCNAKPAPNDIEISGEAVALHCLGG